MPLPSPNRKEKRKDFVSRCVADLTRKGEGESPAQRVAICNSKYRNAKADELLGYEKKEDIKKKKKRLSLNSDEIDVLREVMENE